MSNRNILVATGLFLVLVLGFIVSSPSSKHKTYTSDDDFTIHIPSGVPDSGSVPPEVTQPVAELSREQQHEALAEILAREHITVSSKMSSDKKWFPLDFDGLDAHNPSVLYHPSPFRKFDYIMLAQTTNNETGFRKEIACAAQFINDTLKCVEPVSTLPVASTVSDKCPKNMEVFNNMVGPHDARAFLGPERPYLIYGSPSSHTCMGMWMQDLSRLHAWDYVPQLPRTEPFFQPTDLQRPVQYSPLEKNWFVFWDRGLDMYIHYDIAPNRVFAKVNATGGIGPDLAPYAYENDKACLAKHLPKIINPGYEHIRQATNSLLVTLCARTDDPACFETEHNTFIMSIFHHSASYGQDVYEPYVMLFSRTPPFELYAISTKPIWINGRNPPAGSASSGYSKSKDQTLYINSVQWKGFGKNYQGYLNDEFLINFSIDDKHSGSIDVAAADLFNDLGLCGA